MIFVPTEKGQKMADLIDRRKLLDWFSAYVLCDELIDPETVMDDIRSAESVDAVEVVRCKDCTHTKTDGCEPPAIYCKKWDRWEMPEDFFCKFGERK